MNSKERLQAQKRKHITLYLMSMSLFMLGMGFAAVPLYRIFCQATGIGGKAVRGHDVDKVEELSKVEDQVIKVMFTADKNSSLRWKFTPQQSFVNVALGETALAFYTAENPTDEPIVGVSTYTVNPIEAGLYFNKIQCFCFEEQLLKPHEKVDLPVFFYIDPEFQDNPFLADCDNAEGKAFKNFIGGLRYGNEFYYRVYDLAVTALCPCCGARESHVRSRYH
ncbi:Cytochrome c oxidase assembly protein COX11, mitochondrial [Mizuhopecten yessoensis]|uniref:Cytochrome c oxidase assembly protein COX11, mitochondrial n=1 Tax=Mizuhopecten yessoensis TaxID=6573 RepID=A0A210QVI2_MIZYE|nr:Cytochrome c oxidase assembly protein COX11, mitochondrial [Mizuhopecten yessoensis]